jgi:hypothetical protein
MAILEDSNEEDEQCALERKCKICEEELALAN